MSAQTVTIEVAPQVAAILEKLKRGAILGEPKKLSHAEKLAVLQHLEERQANRPFTEAGDTVAMLRKARAGVMWGPESTK